MWISPTWQSSHPTFDSVTELEGYAQLSHYTATFREQGEGPPLVLIPGLAGGIDMLGPMARRLARHFRVITYQLRGEDDCFALRRRFDMDDLVDDLAEFLDYHGLEWPHLFGVSFGGVVGLEFAARFPRRVATLSVQGVGARLESNLVKLVAGLALRDFPLPAENAFVNQFFRMLFGRGRHPFPQFDFVVKNCWRTDQSVMTHRFRLIRRRDLRPRLEQIRIPVMVMSAERDVFVSQSSLLELCNGLRNVRFVKLPTGGHLAFVVQPDRIAEEVRQFVGQVE
jgi:3-oxoadipate enol-lactonase